MANFEGWLSGVAMLFVFGCGDELTSSDDEAGTTTTSGGAETSATDDATSTEEGPVGQCGDGVVDPGEACDDGNRDESDGCTNSCEIGPCGFEWVRREPAVSADSFAGMVVDGESMLVLSEAFAPVPYRTRLVRAATNDGALESTTELAFGEVDEWATSFVLGPGDDLFIISQFGDYDDGELRVARVSGDQTLWQVARSSRYSWGLALDGAGELVFASTETLDDTDSDARLTALDPGDGTELWSAGFSGAVAANGYSLDHASDLAVGDGAIYVGVAEYVDWDTVAPTLVAFAEGGGDPLWSIRLLDEPGERFDVRSVAVGPEGTVLLTAQTTAGYFEAGVFAVDATSGELLWSFDYDDLPIERVWTGPTAVASNGELTMVTGFWSYFDGDNGNQQVVQAHTLGFGPDGTLSCLATYDEYDPSDLSELRSFVNFAIEVDQEGDFVLAGIAFSYFDDPSVSSELTLARVRG